MPKTTVTYIREDSLGEVTGARVETKSSTGIEYTLIVNRDLKTPVDEFYVHVSVIARKFREIHE